LALLTFGEGYHNYHHIFENDYRNGILWWHFDPTKWLIKSCEWFGLTTKLRVISEDRIEKSRLAMVLKKTKAKLVTYPNADQSIAYVQQEYDLLIKKINDFYQIRKTLLAAKREKVIADVEKSELMAHYQELKQHLIIQRKSWYLLTENLT
jgi:stearoyl-CoA desaturase (delta-9 desaturase)